MSPVPPQDVQKAAQRAEKWIEQGKAGKNFTDTGRQRARQLANGENVSADVVKRMRDYFARHDVDKDAAGFKRGTEGYPSPGRVAWDAWGGDPGKRWANARKNDTD